METREAAPENLTADEDEQLVRVLDEYLADLEAGVALDPHHLLAEHPALAPRLRTCLAGLQMLDAAATPLESSFDRLGSYTIVREIGRGGMGIVYEATRRGDGQRIALKILPFAASLNPRQLQRFKNEAHAASHLHHPHIVPVYEVGCAGGVHYYTMKFIEGTSLAELWRQRRREARAGGEAARAGATSETNVVAGDFTRGAPRPADSPSNSLDCIRQAAEWAQQAALALEHAHQVGVIHRDIKLGNLLVDDGGRLWVADFGLASVQGGDGLTATGDLVGTFRYMSPEQASARRGVVDHRTDIYSLGVSLYELLTLQQAFQGRDRQELLSQVTVEEPRGIRRLNPLIPVDLETIVLTAMAKAPEERYATARSLADDLGRFLAGEHIHARRPRLPALAAKWALRHRTWVAVIGLFIFVTALGMAAIWGALRAEARQRALAEVRELDSRRHLYAAQMNLALEDWNGGHVARVFELLDRQRPAPDQKDLRGFEWYHLLRLCEHAGCGRLPGDGKPVFALAVAANGSAWASAGESGIIHLWDPETLIRRAALPASGGPIRGLAIDRAGDRLAAGYSDGTIRIWNLATASLQATLTGHSGEVSAVTFSPDGKVLFSSGFGDGTVRVWNADDGQPRAVLKGHQNGVNCLAVSHDGRTVASGSNDRKVLLWDLTAENQEPQLLGEHRVYIHCVAFSADGQTLVSGSEDGFVKFWDMQTRQPKGMLRRHTGAVVGAAFKQNDQLATVSWDGSVKVWNPETQEISLQQGHPGQVFAVAFAPDGKRLLSTGNDGTVRIWDLTADPEPLVLACDRGLIRGLTFSSDSRRIASAGNDRAVRIWDLSRPHEPLVLGQHDEWGMGAALTANGKNLFSVDLKGNITLWDTQTGSQAAQFEPAGGPLWSLALSSDGKLLAGAGYTSNSVYLWEVATGKKRASLVGHQERVWSVAFSPDARLVASSSNDRTVRVWDATSGKQIASVPLSEQWAFAITFSPDGRTLAIAGGDRRVHLWDVTTSQPREPLGLHPASLRCLAYFPDGETLVTGSDDGAVRLWDLHTHQERATLRVQASSVWSVAVAPNGQAVAAGDGDGKITVWRTALP